jgi:integrase
MSAIRTAHRMAGMELPDTTAARLVLRSHRRNRASAGSRTRKAPPVVIDTLRRMIDVCDPKTTAGLRNRLLLVLGFALMGRRSELAALDIADVRTTAEGLVVLIRKSKTDQDADGAEVFLPHGQHADTDPVALVRAWLALLESKGLPADGPLLRSVDRHGNVGGRMPEKSINDAVRRIAMRAGVPGAESYTAHSLRAGGATAAYKGGAPVSAIAAHGRWADGSPVVLGYIRAVDKWTDNPMRGVGL